MVRLEDPEPPLIEAGLKLDVAPAGNPPRPRATLPLKPLAPADFLVYDRDPTRTIDPGRGLLAVVTGGALYRAGDLNRAVARQSAHFGHPLRRALGIAGARRGLASLPSGR